MCFKRVYLLQVQRVKSAYIKKKTVIYCEQNRIYHNIGLQGSASFCFMSQFQFVLDNR